MPRREITDPAEVIERLRGSSIAWAEPAAEGGTALVLVLEPDGDTLYVDAPTLYMDA